jgi:DNA-binding transcriptional LysR family regulator
VAAAEEAHFGRAAERVHISGPGLGQQIKELEEELGVELFTRSPRGVQLTAAGAALLADVRRILGDIRTAVEHAQEVGRGKIGVLRVGHIAMTLLGGRGIGQIIPAFCVRYPSVEMRSVAMTTAEQCAALDEGRIDVGLAYTPPESSSLSSEVLDENLLEGALLPAGHSLTRKNPLRCSDLSALPLLKPPAAVNPWGDELVSDALRARGLQARSGEEHQITDAALRIRLIAAGKGWMPVTAQSVDSFGGDGLAYRKWADAPIPYPLCVVWRSGNSSALVANFISFCREARQQKAPARAKRRKASR